MDQLKVFLGYLVQYRFWISIGIASLMLPIGYFATAGGMIQEEQTKTAEIKGAFEEVKKFQMGAVQNKQWTDEVAFRTTELTKDVNASWRKLYEKQAPLLTWPERVQPTFMKWGRKYPEGVDPQRVRDVVLDYIQDYPGYVDEVYSTFKPFNPEDGSGIVAAAPKEILLAPADFRVESPPTLTEVWSAQEKLWIQRTILDVVAKVNEKAKAKDWDNAIVKEIRSLEVANAYALDQKTAAKEEEVLEDAPEILAPGATPAEEGAEPATSGRMGEMSGGGSGGGGSTPVQYVKSDNRDQYFVVPISLKVFVEQNHINDLLIEFANSPMSIQVLDFEFVRPLNPVRKPRKGEVVQMAASMGARGSRGGMSMGADLMGGGSMDMDMEGYGSGAGTAYNARMTAGGRGRGGVGMGGPGMGNPGAPAGRQGGQNVLNQNLKALKDAKSNKDEKKNGESEEEEITLSNPYFNVVEVTIKGQARFYQTPPPEETVEPTSPGATPEATTAEPASTDAAQAAPVKTDEAPAKTDEAKAEPAKSDEPPAPVTEPAKAEAPKAETPPAPAPPATPETPAAPAAGKPDEPKNR